MFDDIENLNLLYLTEKNQKLPVYLTLLFHSAIDGDETAVEAIVKEFTPSIKKIATRVESQYNLGDEKWFNVLVQSGIKTLKDLMTMHTKEGFCQFILFAIGENMIYTLATRNHNR